MPIDNEGTEVWRPMWADKIDGLIYKIKTYPHYNPKDEILKFKTGDIFICEKRKLSNGYHLIAKDIQL